MARSKRYVNRRYSNDYVDAEQEAKNNGRGIWVAVKISLISDAIRSR
jgi:endonuclease YncB( thermonuclease family)